MYLSVNLSFEKLYKCWETKHGKIKLLNLATRNINNAEAFSGLISKLKYIDNLRSNKHVGVAPAQFLHEDLW